jgi:hypothetical protein
MNAVNQPAIVFPARPGASPAPVWPLPQPVGNHNQHHSSTRPADSSTSANWPQNPTWSQPRPKPGIAGVLLAYVEGIAVWFQKLVKLVAAGTPQGGGRVSGKRMKARPTSSLGFTLAGPEPTWPGLELVDMRLDRVVMTLGTEGRATSKRLQEAGSVQRKGGKTERS